MRTATGLLALFAVALFSTFTLAADAGDAPKPGERHHLLHGIVKKVDGKSITIEIGKGDKAKEVVVETDENTKFTVDHEPAKLDDVKEGELVAISPDTGVAHHVDLNTTHKKDAAK